MENNYKNLTIVIVLYDSDKLVLQSFEKLKNFQIIVVDNGKNDLILDKIKKYPNILKILSKNKNLGYARAINFAYENILTDFFLVINPDLVISEESIINLINVLKNNNDCAIAAPITTPDKDYYGIFPEKGKGVKRNQNEIKLCKILENSKIEGECCVDVAKGCALLINSSYFKKINMFNEKYFLFWEEIDFCRKVRKNKLSVIVTPKSEAHHAQESSSKKNLLTFSIRTYHHELSPLIYFGSKKLSKIIIWRLLKYIFRTFSYLLILNFKKSFSNFLKFLATFNYFIGIYG